MKSLFTRNADGFADVTAPEPISLALAGRACCCPAMPVVTVLMPPSRTRDHVTSLLLCGHHFRASREALRAAGATAYDEAGRMVLGPDCPDDFQLWEARSLPPPDEVSTPGQRAPVDH